MRRIDLANQLQLSPSGITRLLDRLEDQGFVGKGECKEDARVSYAILTDAGLAKLREAAPGHIEDIEQPAERGVLERGRDEDPGDSSAGLGARAELTLTRAGDWRPAPRTVTLRPRVPVSARPDGAARRHRGRRRGCSKQAPRPAPR